MKPTLAVRKRSPLFADLRILLLGTWGFFCQCWRSWGLARKGRDELEAGE